jgi:methionine aminopeptidase
MNVKALIVSCCIATTANAMSDAQIYLKMNYFNHLHCTREANRAQFKQCEDNAENRKQLNDLEDWLSSDLADVYRSLKPVEKHVLEMYPQFTEEFKALSARIEKDAKAAASNAPSK